MTTTANFYVIGGTLRRDAPSYVKRQADDDLHESLTAGQYCYVLTSRQMGKSSLMVRTAVRLRAEGMTVVVLDLTAIGQNVTAEQWYEGLLGLMGQQLDLEDELDEFWLAHRTLGPLQRWMQATVECVLARAQGKLVIFVDEIDAVRSLPFSTDEFFAGIREFYNRRTQEPGIERLTFCLLGVATPSDLVSDTRTTPFNIGRRIELQDFTIREAQSLAQGLGRDDQTAGKILNRVLYWTAGHPYLTQRLCQAIAEDQSVTNGDGVDRVCQELFLSSRARERDDNLIFVRERLLRSEEADRISLLDLYSRIRKHKKVPDDEADPLVSVLRLAGITRVVRGFLQVRNRIYDQAFDTRWVRANMPDAELQRQRRAYRTGQMRAAAIAAIVITVLTGSVTFYAFKQKRLADQNALEVHNINNQLQQAMSQLRTVLSRQAIMTKPVNLRFAPEKSELDVNAQKALDPVASMAQMYSNADILVECNTDEAGNPEANRALTQRRAQAVVDFLVEHYNLDKNRFMAIGNGSDKPLGSKDTEEGRTLNRRTDIKLVPRH
jgi:outer membrane protein OmpA-like peptidoglycan-associated protein